jgi:hypothetical protein
LLVTCGTGAGQKADRGLSCCVFLQVPREDPCEFCLCLDGELFCWWQDCPPCGSSRPSPACGMASSGGNIHRTLCTGIEGGVPGASFGLRLHIRTGVLVTMLSISRQILCYWAYYKIGHDSVVPYPLRFSSSNLTLYNVLFWGKKRIFK